MNNKVSQRRGWLAAPEAAPRLPADQVDSLYKKLRASVFSGIFIGYAGYYLIRNNVSLVAPLLQSELGYDKVALGVIANAVLISYGLSKFFMATLSDRSNARYFLPLGLALSALMNLLIAFVPFLTASISVFATVMFINGWFQGMGWPPSGRSLVHWFSTSERGWKTSVWNTAHNVGGALVGVAAAAALSWTGNQWQSAFWFPAIIALVVAAIAFLLMRDRPVSVGLPPIEEYRNDPPKKDALDPEMAKLSYFQMIMRYVVTDRVVVMLAITNVFVYTLRYGVLYWIPFYLTDVHGYKLAGGIAGFSLYELAGIVGTLLCGWVSDRIFRGWRSGAGILFLGLTGVFIALYWLAPAGAPFWLLMLYVAVIGGSIYGPVMLIGLQAIDLSPANVAGTAAGFTKLFGYLLGASFASTGVGVLIKNFGWNVTYLVLIGVCVLAVVLMMIIGRDEKRLMREHAAKSA